MHSFFHFIVIKMPIKLANTHVFDKDAQLPILVSDIGSDTMDLYTYSYT